MSLDLPLSVPPNPQSGSSSELQPIEIYGFDLKVHKLAIVLNQPPEKEGKKFLAVKAGDKEVYVAIKDLVNVTGILERQLTRKDPDKLSRLIKNQNSLLRQTVHVVEVAKQSFPTMGAFDSDLSKFVTNQLEGRYRPTQALTKLSALMTKTNSIRAAAFAGHSNSVYVGKIKGPEAQERMSLLVSDGDVYIGGAVLGEGGTSKISILKSLPNDPFRGAKAVARGRKKVDQLERHLLMVEMLNREECLILPLFIA